MVTTLNYLEVIPEANGVEKSEPPNAGVELNDGVAVPKREGVEAAPDRDAEDEPNRGVCGEAPAGPNKEEAGAEAEGVANNEADDTEEGAEAGVPKSENPLPEDDAA